jgi:PAS domain S-box-containing protein
MTLSSDARAAWRVVIVDDSEEDREETRRLLLQGSERRYVFTEAETVAAGARTIRGATGGPPDCVVLDFNLPDGSAVDLLAELTEPDGSIVCPVVVITGGAGAELGRQVLRAGAQDFIGKSWMTMASLTRSVENAVERWAMARELRASEARFRHLAAAVPQAVWQIDAGGALTYANERWRDYFGAGASQALDEVPMPGLHPDDAVEARQLHDASRARGEPYEIDVRLRRVDGEYRWHHVNVVPMRDERGAIAHWYGVNTDVHERNVAKARLKLALEASKIGIWSWDVRTDAVLWSPECYAIHGMVEGSFAGTGNAFFALVHETDRARVETTVRDAIEGRTTYRCEFRIVRPDGEVVWVENLGRAGYDAFGPERILGTIADISERKRAEEARSKHERELQTLADSLPDIISRFDRELRHVFVSAAVERVTGLPPTSFLGKTNRDLGMPADVCETWEAALRHVFTTALPHSFEFEFRSPDQPRSFASRLVPELAPDGKVEFVVAVANDITEQRAAEDALRASEERLARAQRAAHVGTWDWNVVTNDAIWTEEAWRLFGPARRTGTVSYDLWLSTIHPDDRPGAAARSLASLETGIYRDEFRVVHPDGTVLWLEAIGEGVFGTAGTPIRLLGTVRDITERRDAELALKAALDRAERAVLARDQLVSLVSHDLRSPLGVILMSISLLEGHVDADAREIPVKMARQAKRMGKMLDELLDVAQLQAGNSLDLERGDVDLVSLSKETADDFQRSSPKHHIEVDADATTLVGDWDRQRIERVVGNLLSNAIKYSPAGGAVRLEVESFQREGATWARLRVTDVGIGVTEKDRATIFEWFARGRNARKSGISGIGIGLAGVRNIVEQHGGSISVASVESKGSTFMVELPLTHPRALVAPPSAESSLTLA